MANDTPVIQTQIDKDLQDSLVKLANRHVTISFSLIALIALILVLCGVGAYFGEKSWERAMDKAESAEKQMDADRAQYQQTLEAMQRQIDANNQQIEADQIREQSLVNQIANRDTSASTAIGKVLTPGKTATDAFVDLKSAYKEETGPDGQPVDLTLNVSKDPISGDQMLTFSVPAVQMFSATALAEQRDGQDLTQTKQALLDEQDVTAKTKDNWTACQGSLTSLQTTESQCEVALQKYKSVAKKSRFRSIMGGVLKVAIFAAGLELGHKL